MNTKVITIVGVILVVVVIGFLTGGKKEAPEKEAEQKQVQNISSPQVNSEGSVEVEVTPVEVSGTSDQWKFKIVMDTHSVELDQDLTMVTRLVDDKGNLYTPLSWDGAPPGGHHREGTLSFAPVFPRPERISIVVTDIGNIAERNFSWELGR